MTKRNSCPNEPAINKDVVLVVVAVEVNRQPNEALNVAIDETAVTDMLCAADAGILAPTAVDTGVDYPELVER